MTHSRQIRRRDFLRHGLAGTASLALANAQRGQERPSKKLRLGVVGSGTRSRGGHLPILLNYVSEVEIVALCDITPENLAEGLRICGSETAGYTDYRRMLDEHPELDAVAVVIPNYLHADITVHALEAGKHVLVEKPMATHLADADRMIRAAHERNLILQVGQQNRYASAHQRMAELIRQGAIGDLELVFAALFRGDWNPRSWRYTDPQSGKQTNWRFLTFTTGSSLLEDGIHELDVIHWLVGAKPKRIQAQGGNSVFKDRETIDNAQLLIEFSNGVRCTFAFSVFTPQVPDSIVMRLFGSQGEMHLETKRGDAGSEIVISRYRGPTERIPVPDLQPEETPFWKGGRDIATYRLHKAFVNSITTSVAPLTDGIVGRDAIHISLTADRSLRTGQILSWGDVHPL